jgi:DNA-binding transcriptional MerR regulator
MFRIGDFSRLCRVPVSALRYYADIGLLEPIYIDSATNYRYYSLDQLPRLNRILALKDLGLALDQISQLLDEAVSFEEMRGMLRLRQAEIEQELTGGNARLQRVVSRLRQIEHEGQMPAQEVVLKAIEPQRIIGIREIIPTGDHIASLLGNSFGALMRSGIQPIAPPFTIFHDEEFKPTELDVEIALPVEATVKDPLALGDGRMLTVRELPAMPFAACTIHRGNYDTLLDSYDMIGRWIETNGYQIVGSPHEIYLNPPNSDTPTLTEIQYPVEKH